MWPTLPSVESLHFNIHREQLLLSGMTKENIVNILPLPLCTTDQIAMFSLPQNQTVHTLLKNARVLAGSKPCTYILSYSSVHTLTLKPTVSQQEPAKLIFAGSYFAY